MDEPLIAARGPAVLEMEPGTYDWCRCGRSASQPFCDGSHAGSGFSPMKVEIVETRWVAWCRCKRTGTPPFCDGTHKRLD